MAMFTDGLCIWPVCTTVLVPDREVGRCPNLREMGSTRVGGMGEGPAPQAENKMSSCSRGGDNSLMEQQGGREEESSVTKRTDCAQST